MFWRFVDFGVRVSSSVVTQLARISDDRPVVMKRLQVIVKVCLLMFCVSVTYCCDAYKTEPAGITERHGFYGSLDRRSVWVSVEGSAKSRPMRLPYW